MSAFAAIPMRITHSFSATEPSGTMRTVSIARGAKILVAESGHVAVTTKGCVETGAKVAKMLCDRADRYGATATIAEMQEFATWVGDQLGVDDSGKGLKVCIAAWLPGPGRRLYGFPVVRAWPECLDACRHEGGHHQALHGISADRRYPLVGRKVLRCRHHGAGPGSSAG